MLTPLCVDSTWSVNGFIYEIISLSQPLCVISPVCWFYMICKRIYLWNNLSQPLCVNSPVCWFYMTINWFIYEIICHNFFVLTPLCVDSAWSINWFIYEIICLSQPHCVNSPVCWFCMICKLIYLWNNLSQPLLWHISSCLCL